MPEAKPSTVRRAITAAAAPALLASGVAIGQPSRVVVVESVAVHNSADGCWTEQALALTVDGEPTRRWGEVYKGHCDPALERGPAESLAACQGGRPAEARRENEPVGCAE